MFFSLLSSSRCRKNFSKRLKSLWIVLFRRTGVKRNRLGLSLARDERVTFFTNTKISLPSVIPSVVDDVPFYCYPSAAHEPLGEYESPDLSDNSLNHCLLRKTNVLLFLRIQKNKVKGIEPPSVLGGGFPPVLRRLPWQYHLVSPAVVSLPKQNPLAQNCFALPAVPFSRDLCRGGGRFTGRKSTTTQAKSTEKSPRERRGFDSLHLNQKNFTSCVAHRKTIERRAVGTLALRPFYCFFLGSHERSEYGVPNPATLFVILLVC